MASDDSKFADILSKKIDEQIASYSKKRKALRRRARFSHLLIAFCSFGAAGCLGMEVDTEYDGVMKNVALALTLIGGLLSSVEAFVNHKELWIRYTTTANRLKSLQMDFYRSQSDDVPRVLDEIHERLQQILADDNLAWQQVRKGKEDSPGS